jgi:hypothetical protein
LSRGLIYCDPSRQLNFWRPTPSALLALGLRSHTDIPALKELEEWFDTQKEMKAIAKLDSYFERISRLAFPAAETRNTAARNPWGVCARAGSPHLKRIPTEESGSDLFRSDGPDAAALSYRVESPQSVMQGCLGPREHRWARGKGAVIGSIGEIFGRAAVGLAGPALSPGAPETQGDSEAWFLDWRVPQKHFVFRDFEAIFWPFSRSASGRRGAYCGDQGRVSPACDGGVFHGAHLLCESLIESPSSAEPLFPHRIPIVWTFRRLKNPRMVRFAPSFR